MAVRRRDRRGFGVAAVVLGHTVSIGSVVAQDIVKDAKASLADLPAWKIPDICAKDSAQSHCLALESRAWRTVSGSWVSVPDAVKKLCLGAVRSPADRSWRVLGDCVDEEMDKAGDKKAVATARTPAEAVPAPKAPPSSPGVAIAAVPPPVLGLNIAPPPFALDAEAAAKRAADEAAAKKIADDAAEAKRKADADAKRLADEASAKKAAEEAEAKRTADAATKRLADEADAKKAAEDAEAKRKADAETKRLADEAAAKKAAEAAEAKRVADAAAAKRAEVEAAAKLCQDNLQTASQTNAIRFRSASASIDRDSNAVLDRLADVVKACPGNQVRVEGHTDSNGEPSFNLSLSRNRAQAVVDYLVKAGVDATLVAAEGFGDSKPIAANDTSEGRAQNRRIEFKVQAK